MKHRTIIFAVAVLALAAVAVFASAGQVSSQEPTATQSGTSAIMAEAQAPAAPTSLLFSYQGQLLNAVGAPITQTGMPMTFRLYPVASAGTLCWTETRAIDVSNGLFNVLLGQTVAINSACLAGDVYLELVVNGETMTPRERLASVTHAMQASYLPNGAVAQGDLGVVGNLSSLRSISAQNPNNVAAAVNLSWLNNIARIRVGGDGVGVSNGLDIQGPGDRSLLRIFDNGDVTVNGTLAFKENPGGGSGDRATVRYFAESGENTALEVAVGNDPDDDIRLVSTGPINLQGAYTRISSHLFVDGWNIAFGGTAGGEIALRHDGGRTLHLLPWGGSGRAWDNVCIGCGSTADLVVNGNLDLRGSCTRAPAAASGASENDLAANEDCVAGSIMSGAYVEANLLTPQERGANAVERFEQGDLLCWSATSEQLERCSTANDRLVMAVADPDGRPIVIGAEPIKVLGPVQAGDILVSSDVPGYARVNNEPKPGTVIGQSLEGFDGEMGLVKAMIRKW